MNYFFSGNLAILAQSSVYMADLSEEAKARGFSWDVAPLVVYKEYEDPSDPDCDTVKAQGKQAGHSNSLSMVVRTGSEKKDDAVRFMMWMASEEGQRIRASIGFFPNQKSLLPEVEFKKASRPAMSACSAKRWNFRARATGGICPITYGWRSGALTLMPR